MDGFLDLGGSEVVETTESFWRDPERLRRAGERLKIKAAMSADPRYEMLARDYAPKPAGPSLASQVGYRHIDEAFDPEVEAREARTRAAQAQIFRALEIEKREAEQKRRQARARAQAEFCSSPLGALLTRRNP
jgi:hypothetical protein